HQCMSGNHHLCPQVQATIIGHRGGFASHIRAHWAWAIPLPEKLNFAEAGPLLCGGITVFAPLTMYARPTDRVGIIGIGGLGHLAVKFAAAYGCDVTAFTSSESKFDEAKGFGANQVVSSKDSAAIKALGGSFDPPVPIMDETTASLDITVEGLEVVERWRKQGCWEQRRRWPAERKEGVARLEFRRPPPPPRGWEAPWQATESRCRTRPYRRSPCGDASPLSTSFAFSARPIVRPSPANSAPCCAARACTRLT